MMDDNMRDDTIMDLDLNQEPLDPSTGSVLGLGSLLNELETAHDQIEERIRQLEAVTTRARQRQRWRQARNRPETSNGLIETIGSTSGEQNGEYRVALQEGAVERAKICKRDSTHLVAKALELDTDLKKVVGDGGGFFDCNVCLDMAREPVLTCCGHLFCWECFYLLPYVYSTAKECPVCKGEVTDVNITPIYGNGNNTHMSVLESGAEVPPRPQAHRIESVRQQRVNWGMSHIPVAAALRRIRMEIGAREERPQQQDLSSVSISSDRSNMAGQVPTSEVSSNTMLGGSRRLRSRQFSRVLSETAASLSSISSALTNPSLFEDLELYIHDRLLGRSDGQILPVDGVDPFTSSAAVVQSQNQSVDSIAEMSSAAPFASSSQRMDVSASDMHLENLRRITTTEMDLTDPRPSSSSRRRNRLSRVSDADNGVSREPRRRRLS